MMDQPSFESRQATTSGALKIIFLILLMDVIGIMVISPVAPYIVQRYSRSALSVTLLTVLYAAAQFFAAPLLGKLSDRYGRRPVILVSVAGAAAAYTMFGVGGALWVLFLARLLGGITGGNMSACSAYIADISPPQIRAKNFAVIGMAWAFGLILGPALGAVFGQIDLDLPAFVAAGLSLVNLILGLFFLPESLPAEKRQASPLKNEDINPFKSIIDMARKPGLGELLLVLSLFNFAFTGVVSTETLFYIHKFDALPGQIGLLLTLYGVAIAVVQLILLPRLVPRFGESALAIFGMLGQIVGVIAIFFVPYFWMIYPVVVLSRSANSFVFPALTTLTSNQVTAAEQGSLMGVTTALASLMNMAGSMWAGAIYDWLMPGAPFWTGALFYGLAALSLLRYTRRRSAQAAVKP